MITNEELVNILNKYSLGRLIIPSIERITDGWVNITLKVKVMKSNEITYIIREYQQSTDRIIKLKDIELESKFISYLHHQYNLPVVPPLDPPGIFQTKEGNYCTLYPFIDGIKSVNTPKIDRRPLWQTIEIGRFLGRLHSIDKRDDLFCFSRRTINIVDTKYKLIHSCNDFQVKYTDLYMRIRRIIDKHTNSIPIIENELEQIQFEKYFEKDLPQGFIHLDIHDDNVLFHAHENKISAVLDFDDMSYGPYLIDVSTTLCFWCSCASKFSFDYAKQFLIEYQIERKENLTEHEWNLLELYCYMTFLHQILFVTQLNEKNINIEDAVIELLLPIEQISEEKSFLEKIK